MDIKAGWHGSTRTGIRFFFSLAEQHTNGYDLQKLHDESNEHRKSRALSLGVKPQPLTNRIDLLRPTATQTYLLGKR